MVRGAGLSPFWSRRSAVHGRAGNASGSRGLTPGEQVQPRAPTTEALCSRAKFSSLNFHHFLFFRKNYHNYNVHSS